VTLTIPFWCICICKVGWDLSGRLGYFVTFGLFQSPVSFVVLGFERKARLFCDWRLPALFYSIYLILNVLGFERKARLFCDVYHAIFVMIVFLLIQLGFERKARLFCDNFLWNLDNTMIFVPFRWDLSGRLGYFVT